MFGGGGRGGGMPFGMMFPPGAGGGSGPAAGPQGVDPFQMLFGGPLGGMAADPAVVQQFLQEAFQGQVPMDVGMPGMPAAAGQGGSTTKSKPGTSKATLRSLPRIKVTAYDIAANEGSECAICLEELELGQPALRIPCGHMFHEDCVKDWLMKSNECPTCRFELPTDDKEYEQGRIKRMAGRKIRMRHVDLTVKSAQELRRLADFIGVDVRNCLEKSEFVERIAASEKVQIIDPDSAAESSSAPPFRPPTFSATQLEAMSAEDVKALMAQQGVNSAECAEKADMIQKLVLSGRILVVTGDAAPPQDADLEMRDSTAAQNHSSPSASVGGGNSAEVVNLQGKSVGELRQLAKRFGVSLDGCLEKGEIVQRIKACPQFRSDT